MMHKLNKVRDFKEDSIIIYKIKGQKDKYFSDPLKVMYHKIDLGLIVCSAIEYDLQISFTFRPNSFEYYRLNNDEVLARIL